MRRSLVLLALLLAILQGAESAHAAEAGRSATVVTALPSVGVATTELLQVNVANVSRSAADPRRAVLAVQIRLLDERGGELARSDRETLAVGATFSWKVTRELLDPSAGDARGRIQVRAEILVSGTPRVGAFVPSLELVSEATGEHSGMIGDIRTVISAEAAF